MPAPKKALGQNFLMHQATAERIADSAHLDKKSVVLEIGPGTGMLTRALLARAGTVVAIETDAELIPILERAFVKEIGAKRLRIVHGDFRTFSLTSLPKGYHVVANIPYYITGEIIRTLLTARNKPASVTLLVQKEVAERVARSEKESLLSLSVKAYGVPKYKFTVPRGAFRPAPNVDSAVLSIREVHNPFMNEAVESRFFEILHAGFAHKRKRLAKNLEAVAEPEIIKDAMEVVGLDVNERAEDVALTDWILLSGQIGG